jgi:hypothetical protein
MVQIPMKLDKKSRAVLEEFSRIEGEDTSPKPIPLSDLHGR